MKKQTAFLFVKGDDPLAAFDAARQTSTDKCIESRRIALLGQIVKW